MAFNAQEKGRVICKIKGGDENNTLIYLDTNYKKGDANKEKGLKKINYFDKLTLPVNSTFEQYPDTTKERDVGLIAGASGSGKSYYVNQYIKNYRKAYKKRPIYFFSVLNQDDSIDEKIVKRVELNDSWLTEPLTIDDVRDSLVVFDDVEQIKDKGIKEQLFKFINECLTTGRHTNTSVFLIVHYTNKPYIQSFLMECHTFTYFPRGSNRSTNYALESYIGIDKKEIKYIKSLDTRWATVFKQYPNCVMTERDLFMLTNLEL
jgi:hypothetical protein